MKQQRHTVIRELLTRTAVPSQDELRRKLAGRGFHVTQATLSRDIHELRLSKGPNGYSLPAGTDAEEESLYQESVKYLKVSVWKCARQRIFLYW